MGLVLAIRADLRDDRGELVDLEAQGATPALLRRVVAARAALVGAVGRRSAASLAGVVLAFLVTRVVSVTARADAPEPPLATTVDPLSLVLGGIAVRGRRAPRSSALTTRRAFADPRGPGSDRWGGVTVPLVDLRDVFVVHPSEDGGVAALRGLTLAVERGELCVVLGPSGAGQVDARAGRRGAASGRRPGSRVVDGLDVGAARGARDRAAPRTGRRLRRPALLARALRAT